MGGDPCPFTRKRLAVTLVGTCSHVRIEQSDPMCGLGYPCTDAVVGGGAGAAVKPCCSIDGFCGSSSSHCAADSCVPWLSARRPGLLGSACRAYPPEQWCGPNADDTGRTTGVGGVVNLVVPEFYPVATRAVHLSPCCKVHDACYSMCTKTQGECDVAFRGCIVARCRRRYGAKVPPLTGNQEECIKRAGWYYAAVAVIGGSLFTDAQLAAGCSPPPPPRCFETGTCGDLGDRCNPRAPNCKAGLVCYPPPAAAPSGEPWHFS